MARKRIERNISYDDARKRYYVSMELERTHGADQRRRQYRTFPTISAARAALREYQVQRDSAGAAPARQPMTLEQWLDEWMETIILPNRAQTTAYSYRNIIGNHLVPALGNIPLTRLTPADIQQYYVRTQQETGLSSNSLRRHHDLLSCALRSAMRQELLPSSPIDRVEPPRTRQKETAFYDHMDLKRLYLLLEGHPLELAVRLAGSLGLRREELCGLRWESVDFSNRLIYIREARTAFGATIVQKETKNRSSTRTMFMPDELSFLLSREKQRQKASCRERGAGFSEEGHIILNRHEEPYSPNALSLAFTRFVRESGLPRITLHGLRHSFATIASFHGVSLFDIGKAMGHSTPATTGRIYTHLVDRTHEDTLLKVSDALK